MAKLMLIGKTFIFLKINLKTILLTKHFDYPIDLNYLIDLVILLT